MEKDLKIIKGWEDKIDDVILLEQNEKQTLLSLLEEQAALSEQIGREEERIRIIEIIESVMPTVKEVAEAIDTPNEKLVAVVFGKFHELLKSLNPKTK